MLPVLLCALALDSGAVVRLIPTAPRETLTVTMRTATVAASTAAAPAVPVVLIPGLIGGAFGYRRVTPPLAEAGHATYIVEPLGVGGSSHSPDGDYSLDAQADRVAAVLDTLGTARAIIIGSNFGASVAMRLAYRRPDLVVAVLLLDGGPIDRSSTTGVSLAMRLAPMMRFFGARGMAKRRIHSALVAASVDSSWVTADVTNAYAGPIIADLGVTVAVMRAMQRAAVPEPLRDNLWRIAQPVRLLIGAGNRRNGIESDEITVLAERLRDFAVDSVANSGAYLAEERSDAVVAAALALGDSTHAGVLSARRPAQVP